MNFNSVYEQLFSSLAIVLILTSCTAHSDTKLPANAKLIAKYQVLDEEISPHHTKCGDIVAEFLQASPYTCSFKLHGLEFDIEKKYTVDSTGHLQEFYTYLAEGPVIYSLKELSKDSVFAHYEKLDNFYIAFSNDTHSIIDGRDTISIEQVFSVEKLIMARRSTHTMRGRRLIYQYK